MLVKAHASPIGGEQRRRVTRTRDPPTEFLHVVAKGFRRQGSTLRSMSSFSESDAEARDAFVIVSRLGLKIRSNELNAVSVSI